MDDEPPTFGHLRPTPYQQVDRGRLAGEGRETTQFQRRVAAEGGSRPSIQSCGPHQLTSRHRAVVQDDHVVAPTRPPSRLQVSTYLVISKTKINELRPSCYSRLATEYLNQPGIGSKGDRHCVTMERSSGTQQSHQRDLWITPTATLSCQKVVGL